jgi:hypothetical protein
LCALIDSRSPLAEARVRSPWGVNPEPSEEAGERGMDEIWWTYCGITEEVAGVLFAVGCASRNSFDAIVRFSNFPVIALNDPTLDFFVTYTAHTDSPVFVPVG